MSRKKTPIEVADSNPGPWPSWASDLAVGAIAVVASSSGIRNAFVFDDVSLIQDNARVQGVGHVAEILTSSYWPPPFARELYRPVASLLHALLFALGDGAPIVFRVASYLLYAACAVGVLHLARRVLPERFALLAGLAFAAHPLHVEAVALAVNQGELIVAGIITLCVVRYVDLRRSGAIPLRDWLLFAAAYLAALLTKENAMVLPGLLVAAELFLIPGETSSRWRELVRGYAVLALVALVVAGIRWAILGNAVGALPAEPLRGLGPLERGITMLQVIPVWLRLLAWPAHLQIDYSPNEIVTHLAIGPAEWLGLGIGAAGIAAILLLRRRVPGASFGLLWCAVALIPVSNIIAPTGIMVAERTLVLPSIGFVIAVVALLAAAVEHRASPLPWRAVAVACLLLIAVGTARSRGRHRVFRNYYRLWVASSADAPQSLRLRRAHAEAIADMKASFLRQAEGSASPWRERLQLGSLLRLMQADSEAVVQLRESLRLRPDQSDARLELSAALLGIGDYAGARQVASAAAATPPDTAAAMQRLAAIADSLAALPAPPPRFLLAASSLLKR